MQYDLHVKNSNTDQLITHKISELKNSLKDILNDSQD